MFRIRNERLLTTWTWQGCYRCRFPLDISFGYAAQSCSLYNTEVSTSTKAQMFIYSKRCYFICICPTSFAQSSYAVVWIQTQIQDSFIFFQCLEPDNRESLHSSQEILAFISYFVCPPLLFAVCTHGHRWLSTSRTKFSCEQKEYTQRLGLSLENVEAYNHIIFFVA